MIRYVKGNIAANEADALVNTVNCVGVMGRGIALDFRKAYPDNYRVYAAACRRGEMRPGQVLTFETGRLTGPRYIINFPTKRHWRGKSRLSDIKSGLESLVAEIRRLGIQSVAVPPLGCGLGGLDWSDVKPLIERALAEVPEVDAEVYTPSGRPTKAAPTSLTNVPKMTPGRAALVGLMRTYLRSLMDPVITLLEVHKLMYFLQEAGEPLKLRYEKAIYGPYAVNLRHLLTSIEGQLISGFEDAVDTPDKQLQLVPGAAADALDYLKEHSETHKLFERVSQLVAGFETPFGLELLSTIHWVATKEGARTPEEAVQKTHAWGARKLRFTPEQIDVAWNVLREQGWLPVSTDTDVGS